MGRGSSSWDGSGCGWKFDFVGVGIGLDGGLEGGASIRECFSGAAQTFTANRTSLFVDLPVDWGLSGLDQGELHVHNHEYCNPL